MTTDPFSRQFAVGFEHQLLMIAIAFPRKSLPIAWTRVRKTRKYSSATRRLTLLAYAQRLIPVETPLLLLADTEFGAVEVIRQMEAWHWQYVLRQKANYLIQLRGHDWQHSGHFIQKPDQSTWLGSGLFTRNHAHLTNLLAHWEKEEKEPWLLTTNLPSQLDALRSHNAECRSKGSSAA